MSNTIPFKRFGTFLDCSRNLHENGICGVMTDYEEKFHNLGTPINRCVGTKLFREAPPAPEIPEDEPEQDAE